MNWWTTINWWTNMNWSTMMNRSIYMNMHIWLMNWWSALDWCSMMKRIYREYRESIMNYWSVLLKCNCKSVNFLIYFIHFSTTTKAYLIDSNGCTTNGECSWLHLCLGSMWLGIGDMLKSRLIWKLCRFHIQLILIFPF